MAKIKILYDTFDICNRIKMLDKAYFVVYDTRKHCYEIHNSEQKGDTFCISVGEVLDYKAIQKLRKTNSHNIKILLDEIDKQNRQLERVAEQKLHDETTWKAGEMYHYAMRNDNASFDDAYKTTWV